MGEQVKQQVLSKAENTVEKIHPAFEEFLKAEPASDQSEIVEQLNTLLLPSLDYNLFSVAQTKVSIVYDSKKDRLLILNAFSFADLSTNSGTCQDLACKTYKLFKMKYPDQDILIAYEDKEGFGNVVCLIPTSKKVYLDKQELSIDDFKNMTKIDWSQVEFKDPFYKINFFDKSIELTNSTGHISTLSNEYMASSDPISNSKTNNPLNLIIMSCHTNGEGGHTIHLFNQGTNSFVLIYMDEFKPYGYLGIGDSQSKHAYHFYDPKLDSTDSIYTKSKELRDFILKMRTKLNHTIVAGQV